MNTVLSVIFGESQPEEFFNSYRCHSFALHSAPDGVRDALRLGGKLLLPQSALRVLTAGPDQQGGPMTFSLTADRGGRSVLVGVHEFTAPEGVVMAPDWVISKLGLRDGNIVRVTSEPGQRSLPRGQFARLRPHGSFLADVTDPKAALERLLRGFVCLSVGDEIVLEHEGRRYQLDIVDLRPQAQVCIADCDLSVEFEVPRTFAPEPEVKAQPPMSGVRRDGRVLHGAGVRPLTSPPPASKTVSPSRQSSGQPIDYSQVRPNLGYAWGSLGYLHHRRILGMGCESAVAAAARSVLEAGLPRPPGFSAFSGPGQRLDGGSGSAGQGVAPATPVARGGASKRLSHCCEPPPIAPSGIDCF